MLAVSDATAYARGRGGARRFGERNAQELVDCAVRMADEGPVVELDGGVGALRGGQRECASDDERYQAEQLQEHVDAGSVWRG